LTWLLLVAVVSAAGSGVAWAQKRPQEILSWRHQMLPAERYEALAEEWEAFVGKHPNDPRAWVEWGDALRYTGKRDEAMEKYKRAFEIDSSDVAALVKYTDNVTLHKHATADWALAKERLLRASKMEPGFSETYYALWLTSMRTGDQKLTETCLRRMVESGDMPRPLFDFGHNMIEGAPKDAIIFTNGDNDTYPPLAYQVITGARPDVSIVNLSLLNTKWFVKLARDMGVPVGLSDDDIAELKHTKESRIAHQVQRRIFDNLRRNKWPRPLFYCVTVAESNKVLKCDYVLEGLLLRIVPATDTNEPGERKTDLPRLRELFDTVYRLESATDPLVDWERESAVARLTTNYTAILHMMGTELLGAGDPSVAGPYLYKAMTILAFHNERGHAKGLLEAWESADPKSVLLGKARKLLESSG
jgi:tetratricopeptide (TPR) repeat protein